jgi:glutamate--cysteine ligase
VTLDRGDKDGLERPIGSVAELAGYFRAGEKAAPAFRVGLEHEKIALASESGAPVAYEGEHGIGAILRDLGAREGWQPVDEAGRIVALDRDGASVTIEPGGQLELSGAPSATVHEIARELRAHLDAAKAVGERHGVVWIALGAQPLHETDTLPRMPKERYRIMRAYLPTRGALALDMMHATASVQASYDYSDEADAVAKMRAALGLGPVVNALYANSSLYAGKASGYVSRRLAIWRQTDPDRCGGVPFVFDPDFGYERYTRWALDVPMFFIVRDGRYTPLGRTTFREFLERGHEGERATLADFDRHLTTLFPDVRLKRLIEVRGADSVPVDLVLSVPALWKGLLYDADARAAAFALVAGWSAAEREAAYDAVARRGLRAVAGGRRVIDLAREVVAIAATALRRLAARDGAGRDESVFLDALRPVLDAGRSPGEEVLERWEGAWQRDPRRLIADTRY